MLKLNFCRVALLSEPFFDSHIVYEAIGKPSD